MKKFLKIFLWIIVAAIVAGTFYFLYRNSKPKEDHYATVLPEVMDIRRTTVLNGKIEPRDEIQVKPQISGIISQIDVEAGDFVHEGDVIARIKVIPEASQLSSAQSRIDAAQVEAEDALVKFNRSKDLYEKKVISREEYENAEKTLVKARQDL
ncbi:MAG: biotin/lipoyl-binding protein, partial [Muribaculaceae bacterium]|nr:biotin/lipoyl-binding protein [Muribaculaceae bacterium]